jgi:hypothetical protein
MSLWKNQGDNASNSVISAVMQYNKAVTTANQTLLFGNTRPGTFVANLAVGQFGVTTGEASANPKIPHAGWVLRKEGTGGRAGRVTYEVLVAAGSLTGDASDDTYFPDYTITFSRQATSNSAQTGNVAIYSTAVSAPTGATLTYKWQQSYAGATAWADIPNVAGVWFNNTSPTLLANVAVANANTVRVVVSATGANTITSSNASIVKLP